jgi:phenylacetate-CoA ligase
MGMIRKAYWSAMAAWHGRHERTLPWWPAERLAALQDRRARAIVAHAYATVPYYRDAMRSRNLRPADFRTAADLAKLPLVGGAELAAPERFLSSAFVGQDTLLLDTTGTTGHYKQIRHDPNAVVAALAAGGRRRAVTASVPGPRRRGRSLVIVPPRGTNASVRDYHRAHLLEALIGRFGPDFLSFDRPFTELVAEINRLEPDVIVTFGRFAGYLYRRALEAGIPIHAPRLIWYGGDAMAEADRRLIEERHGVPVFSSYQSCEFLRIAFQCERRQGFHVSMDHVALRVVDESGRDVAPGTPGEVVISNLVNRATVLLNYRLGDRVTVAGEPCACGRTLPVLASLEGRREDLLVRADGERVHESLVLRRLYGVPGLSNVEVVQQALDRIDANMVIAPGADAAQSVAELRIALAELLGHPAGLEVGISVVDEIRAGPGGKFRAVTCRVPR